MKIKDIEKQYRRDFVAVFECEHCGHLERRSGYDDDYFHQTVIPNMVCKQCGEKAPSTYTPRSTKYAAHEII